MAQKVALISHQAHRLKHFGSAVKSKEQQNGSWDCCQCLMCSCQFCVILVEKRAGLKCDIVVVKEDVCTSASPKCDML
jgi:hypothetical protein